MQHVLTYQRLRELIDSYLAENPDGLNAPVIAASSTMRATVADAEICDNPDGPGLCAYLTLNETD